MCRHAARTWATRVAGAVLLLIAPGCGLGEELSEESATFDVDGSTAVMAGLIGPTTPDRLDELIDGHPEVEVIVMIDVPGSEDDEANLEASRALAATDIATHVPADGLIASGGLDFYLAGAGRTYEPGARFGVHSWLSGDGRSGSELADDDPEHDLYLSYYAAVGIDAEFYWFTLEAAPPEGIHYMTDSEIDRFEIGEAVDSP